MEKHNRILVNTGRAASCIALDIIEGVSEVILKDNSVVNGTHVAESVIRLEANFMVSYSLNAITARAEHHSVLSFSFRPSCYIQHCANIYTKDMNCSTEINTHKWNGS
ncbi:hypothetical protein T4D_5291 [Trichinella pseudospiralis]|uniref:Uncharacterized protein n=1 Tax=Trichinella pseudospiralis TaxID=6337 RepID=A0A0V1F593_TRIPS|nr:hypothetical protein T4D_5291 [Trichinella pseudospiralis]